MFLDNKKARKQTVRQNAAPKQGHTICQPTKKIKGRGCHENRQKLSNKQQQGTKQIKQHNIHANICLQHQKNEPKVKASCHNKRGRGIE